MKRLSAVILSAAMCFSLAACSGSSSGTAASAASGEATQSAASGEQTSSWPKGSVNVYCNQSAGGGTDMMARLVATAMGEATGKSFAVINDTSGATTTACEIVRTSKPSADDILICNTGTLTRMISGQYAQSLDDFSVLGLVSTPTAEGYGIFVKGDSKFDTFEDFLEYSKANPGELITNGQVGGFVMFMEAALEKELDYRGMFVDGGSDGDRILDLLGGSTDYALLSTISANQYVESGDLKCLAMVGSKHSELMPDVKTLDDLGYQSLEMANILMLLGPAGMSEADIARVGEVLKAASENETLIEGYKKLNCAWEYKDPQESREYLNGVMAEMQDAYPVVKEMGLG